MVFSVVYGNGETSSPRNSYRAGYPGRLAYSTDSGAGKRRLFAIGNFGLQRLLSPFHDFLMEVLRKLPTYGTSNLVRPLDCLVGFSKVYSFDLKSAVDTSASKIHR